jgi:hypothetical protein
MRLAMSALLRPILAPMGSKQLALLVDRPLVLSPVQNAV